MNSTSALSFIDFAKIFRDDKRFIVCFSIVIGGNNIGRDMESEEVKHFTVKDCEDD
jgi:hypothetical protein